MCMYVIFTREILIDIYNITFKELSIYLFVSIFFICYNKKDYILIATFLLDSGVSDHLIFISKILCRDAKKLFNLLCLFYIYLYLMVTVPSSNEDNMINVWM